MEKPYTHYGPQTIGYTSWAYKRNTYISSQQTGSMGADFKSVYTYMYIVQGIQLQILQ